MADKGQKEKSIPESIFLFQHRKDLLFFSYDSSHPKRIDIDDFYMGKLRLFKKDKIYSAELRSKPYLNPLLIWNAETFELMLKRLNDFVIEEQTIDFSECLYLCIYIKVKGRQINLLKIKLNQQFGIDIQTQLWNEFKKYNSFKTKNFAQSQEVIQILNNQIQQSLDNLENVQVEQNEKVDGVKKKLSALMNEKEKKIRQLSGNHLYEWANQERQKQSMKNDNQNFQPSISNWMSSQDDRVLVGSLFAPSQNYPF